MCMYVCVFGLIVIGTRCAATRTYPAVCVLFCFFFCRRVGLSVDLLIHNLRLTPPHPPTHLYLPRLPADAGADRGGGGQPAQAHACKGGLRCARLRSCCVVGGVIQLSGVGGVG